MTKTALAYWGRKGTYIIVRLRHKAQKGNYKNDLIDVHFKSATLKRDFALTEYEAVILANGLLQALMLNGVGRK